MRYKIEDSTSEQQVRSLVANKKPYHWKRLTGNTATLFEMRWKSSAMCLARKEISLQNNGKHLWAHPYHLLPTNPLNPPSLSSRVPNTRLTSADPINKRTHNPYQRWNHGTSNPNCRPSTYCPHQISKHPARTWTTPYPGHSHWPRKNRRAARSSLPTRSSCGLLRILRPSQCQGRPWPWS